MKTKILALIFAVLFLFTACGQKDITPTDVPFTEVTWNSTLEQICEAEGADYEESLSMAGGNNYIYANQYLGYDGFVQYNIDDTGNLAGISWFYIGNDFATANEIYEAIEKDTSSLLGKVEPIDSSNIHAGYKWETKDCTVFLIAFAQNEEYAVQISYLIKDAE